MRYLLLLYGEPVRPESLTPEQWQGVMEAHTTFHRELTEADAAVEWAQRLRHDADGSIEVRPLLQLGVDSGPTRSS